MYAGDRRLGYSSSRSRSSRSPSVEAIRPGQAWSASSSSVLLAALIYGVFGWIFTAIACAIYNLAAGWVGGIEVQVNQSAPPPARRSCGRRPHRRPRLPLLRPRADGRHPSVSSARTSAAVLLPRATVLIVAIVLLPSRSYDRGRAVVIPRRAGWSASLVFGLLAALLYGVFGWIFTAIACTVDNLVRDGSVASRSRSICPRRLLRRSSGRPPRRRPATRSRSRRLAAGV